MVEISITREGYSVTGHADQAEHGYDIVCSAVSVLTQTIALSLQIECNAKVENNLGGYFVELSGKSRSDVRKKSALLLKTLIRGLEKVEKDHPEHVKIRIQRGMI